MRIDSGTFFFLHIVNKRETKRKKIKCCVCFVNSMRVNYELRQFVVHSRHKESERKRRKKMDNVICHANIHFTFFHFKCSQ